MNKTDSKAQTGSKAQIVATLGPVSNNLEMVRAMVKHQLDVIRLNFSWGDEPTRLKQIAIIRQVEGECGRKIPIIVDVPGPRVQEGGGHTYNAQAVSAITEEDKKFMAFAALHQVDYIALSFVGGAEDIELARAVIAQHGGKQKIIAKIERAVAVENLEAIVAAADALMVARGDLANEVPMEQMPFVQEKIIKAAKAAGKPVITATGMLLSMVESPEPARSEVTDVSNAILEGSDAVMLSDETARGKYPVEAVAVMEKIVLEAEKHTAKLPVFLL